MSDFGWNRICNTEALAAIREVLVHEDVDHLLTVTHHGDHPFLPGSYAGFDSSVTTHVWLRDVNTNLISELAFIGVHWIVAPESLPLFGTFDSLDRLSLYQEGDAGALAARCSMLGHRYVKSIPNVSFQSEEVE